MDTTTTPPAALTETLERMNLSDLLTGYAAPERVRRWGFLSVERFAASHGYEFKRRDGNIYGALRLVPVSTAPAPALRIDRDQKRRGRRLRQLERGMTAPLPDGDVLLTPRAEQQFRLEAERVGAYEVDPDEA